MMRNSVEWLAAWFGSVRFGQAGAVIVPVNAATVALASLM
jgi:acyl-CoA synthetase (AMP-forming)/AMP-acid ligase II